jgi:WD40-like Beta Propeller Repeat
MKQILTGLALLLSFTILSQEPKPYAPELFSPEISGAVCGFSSDGNIIYFVKEDTVVKKLFLFQAKKKKGKWQDVQLLPFSGKYNDLGGRLDQMSSTFYFTSDRPGGSTLAKDTWNVWQTMLDGKGWSEPRPLNEINNKGMECCPVPLPNGAILFSADREKSTSWWISEWTNGSEVYADSLNQEKAWQWPSSFDKIDELLFLNSMKRSDSKGMDDIYVSFCRNQVWSSPVNLGGTVNSTAYEDGAILSPDRKWLIFCRHETSSTPSQVLYVAWPPLAKELMKRRKN